MQKITNRRKDTPSTIAQLASAMAALGMYAGENSDAKHRAEAKRLGGAAYYRMLLVNALLGMVETEAMLAEQGLVTRSVLSTTVALHPAKTILLQPEVRERFMDAGISRVGPYEFADVHIFEIRRG